MSRLLRFTGTSGPRLLAGATHASVEAALLGRPCGKQDAITESGRAKLDPEACHHEERLGQARFGGDHWW